MNYLSGLAASNPAILWLACRWLEQAGSCTLIEISQALKPGALVEGQGDQLSDSLDVGLDIGIVALSDDAKKYQLVPGYPESSFTSFEKFQGYLRSSLLDKAVHEIKNNTRPSDVSLGLAWLNTLDPLRPLGWTWNDGVEEIIKNTGQMREVIVNQAQWNSFKRWAIGLGFGYEIKVGKTVKFQPDPTDAISEICKQNRIVRISANEFIKLIIRKIPCLIPGVITEYLEKLNVDYLFREEKLIGPQLGYVLEKLNKRKVINLISADDASDRVAYIWDGKNKTFDFVEFGDI